MSATQENSRSRELAVVLLQAIAFGAVLPHIYFVNDLSHPFQTALLTSLYFVGRLLGKTISARFGAWGGNNSLLVLQGAMLTLIYVLVAISAAVYPTGIIGLRLAQVEWFGIGLLGSHLIFRRSDSEAAGRYSAIDFHLLGMSIGAAIGAAVTWGSARSSIRWALAETLIPAIVAAGLSAVAVGVLAVSRRDWANSERSSEPIRVSAIIMCAVAIPCTLGPMMLWESFEFRPCEVAAMIASAGLLAVAVQRVVGRLATAGSHRRIVVTGLSALFVGVNALSWSPNTGSGIVLSTGIALFAIGWGFVRPMLPEMDGIPVGFGFPRDERVWLIAWLGGTALGAYFFYYHERTSFGCSGLVIAVAAFLSWKREIASRPAEEIPQTETTGDAAASLSR